MSATIHVTALTASRSVPSARFRVGLLCSSLREYGVEISWHPAPVSKYPPARYWMRPFWLPLTTLARLPAVLNTWRTDVTLFSRELVSTLVTLEALTKRPRVFDVDDAIWLSRGGRFASSLALSMDMIVAGNDFLADWFQQYNENVVILPTAVDTQRFRPAPRPYSGSGHSLIGWSGTSSNLPYLYAIEPALGRVLQEFPEAHLRVVCDRAPHFAQLSGEQVEFIRWTPEIEVRSIQEMTIGIMPLESTDWARGKCSYKMLLYMACGVPVVASPVGMNAQVLAEDTVGVGATTQQGWAEALLFLLAQPDERQQMGKNGRLLVEQRYSVAVLAPLMASYLKGVT